MKKHLLYQLCLAGLAVSVSTAMAQDGESRDDKKDDVETLNEITVTGQKLDRTLQETVSGTSIVDDVLIEDTATQNLDNAIGFGSNVNLIDNGNYNSFAIRGVDALGLSGGGNELASVFINGAYMPLNVFYSDVQLWDLDQLVLNKGPQSTTSGRNALAGSININYKHPEFDNTGAVRVGFGSDGWRVGSFMLNGSPNEKFAVRIAAQHSRKDGQVTNVYLNDDKHDYGKTTNVRVGVLYEPTEDLSIFATIGHIDDSQGLALLCTEKNASKKYPCKRGELKANQEIKPHHDFKGTYGTLEITNDFNENFSFKSVTSFSDALDENLDDSDRYHPDSPNVATSMGKKLKSTEWQYDWDKSAFNQEFKLTFKNEQIRTATGVYYAKNKSKRTSKSADPNDFAQFIGAIDPSGNLKLDAGKEYIRLSNNDYGSTEEVTTFAIFNDTDFNINDRLTLNFGMRYDNEEVKIKNKNRSHRVDDLSALDAYLPDVVTYTPANTTLRKAACAQDPRLCKASFTQILSALQQSQLPSLNQLADAFLDSARNSGYGKSTAKVNHAFLPKIGATYKVDDNLTVGYLYSKGYRSGGAGYNPGRGEFYEYNPEFLDNHEFSFKSTWFDGNLIANVNAYYANWRDQQVDVLGGQGPFDSYKANSGESEMYGLELEGRYFHESGMFGFTNIGWAKTEFKDFKTYGVDYSGNQFSGAPEFSANIGIGYNLGEGFNATWTTAYTGEVYQSIDNKIKSKAYTVSNFKLGYAKDDWQVNAFVNNVFDEDTELKYWDFSGYDQYAPIRAQLPARSFGFTFQYSF